MDMIPWYPGMLSDYPKTKPAPVMYETTRDVGIVDAFNWLGRDVAKGEKFYKFTGNAYSAVDTDNEVTLSEYGPNSYPFFGFPKDAVKVYVPEVPNES
jgi:hypothetical protein